MKKFKYLALIAISLFIFTGISIAQTESATKSKTELKAEKKAEKKAAKANKKQVNEARRVAANDYSRYTSLADILRLQAGVVVTGTGQVATVQIRGMNSIMLDTRPLYVYDGVELGRDYTRANNIIDRATIRSVRILSSLNEVNFYGERGRNGVILIRSRK